MQKKGPAGNPTDPKQAFHKKDAIIIKNLTGFIKAFALHPKKKLHRLPLNGQLFVALFTQNCRSEGFCIVLFRDILLCFDLFLVDFSPYFVCFSHILEQIGLFYEAYLFIFGHGFIHLEVV